MVSSRLTHFDGFLTPGSPAISVGTVLQTGHPDPARIASGCLPSHRQPENRKGRPDPSHHDPVSAFANHTTPVAAPRKKTEDAAEKRIYGKRINGAEEDSHTYDNCLISIR
jgi:hypothetical protein